VICGVLSHDFFCRSICIRRRRMPWKLIWFYLYDAWV
jgi:hypothetical protein